MRSGPAKDFTEQPPRFRQCAASGFRRQQFSDLAGLVLRLSFWRETELLQQRGRDDEPDGLHMVEPLNIWIEDHIEHASTRHWPEVDQSHRLQPVGAHCVAGANPLRLGFELMFKLLHAARPMTPVALSLPTLFLGDPR